MEDREEDKVLPVPSINSYQLVIPLVSLLIFIVFSSKKSTDGLGSVCVRG